MRTVILFSLIVMLNASCASGYKKISGFKKTLKTIDTLAIIPPILNLYCINPGMDDPDYDTTLTNSIAKTITSTYSTLLGSKYYLNAIEQRNLKPNNTTLSTIKPLLLKMDESKNLLETIQVDTVLYSAYPLQGSRYLLLTYMEGGYRSKKGVKQQSRKIPLMVVASLLTGHPLTVLGGKYSNCRLYQYLYDRQENKVLYYTKSIKCEENLWEKETTVVLTKNSSKRLYYK